MLGESSAKLRHLLGLLRSHKGQYELVDARIAIARRGGKTLGQMVREEVGPFAGVIALALGESEQALVETRMALFHFAGGAGGTGRGSNPAGPADPRPGDPRPGEMDGRVAGDRGRECAPRVLAHDPWMWPPGSLSRDR